jgi:hypothetical protein
MILQLLLLVFAVGPAAFGVALGARHKALIHIGPWKTGTSYIQTILARNKKNLAEQNIFYSTANEFATHVKHIMDPGFHSIYYLDIRNMTWGDLASISESVIAVLKTCSQDVILSAESFSLLSNVTEARALADMLSCYDVQIVAFYRNQLLQQLSLYDQKTKHVIIPADLLLFLNTVSDERSMNLLTDTFIQVFGRENVTVLDYDAATSHGVDIANLLLTAGEFDPIIVTPVDTTRANIGTTLAYVRELWGEFYSYVLLKHDCQLAPPLSEVGSLQLLLGEKVHPRPPTACLPLHLEVKESERQWHAFKEKYGSHLAKGKRHLTQVYYMQTSLFPPKWRSSRGGVGSERESTDTDQTYARENSFANYSDKLPICVLDQVE